MNAYAKYFKDSKYINLLVNDKEVLEKYNAIWDNIGCLFKKEFDSGPFYNDENIKAQIKWYSSNFYGNKTPKEGEHYTYLSIIFLDSIVNADKKYHPQIFLEECKYVMKKKKIMNTINEELKMDNLMMNVMMNMTILLNSKIILKYFLIFMNFIVHTIFLVIIY